MRRGIFIVFEGVDRAGKSTQCTKLKEKLEQIGHKFVQIRFPDRTRDSGKIIDKFLKKEISLTDKEIHELYAQNRHEVKEQLLNYLNQGVSIVCDRYSYSGVAYSAAKGLDRTWCKQAEIGLPSADLVLYLDIDPKEAAHREEYGNERFENIDFQLKVQQQFYKYLEEDSQDIWRRINAKQDMDTIHEQILQLVLETMEKKSKEKVSFFE